MATRIRFNKTTGIRGELFEDGDEAILEELPQDALQSLRSLGCYDIVPPEPERPAFVEPGKVDEPPIDNPPSPEPPIDNPPSGQADAPKDEPKRGGSRSAK